MIAVRTYGRFRIQLFYLMVNFFQQFFCRKLLEFFIFLKNGVFLILLPGEFHMTVLVESLPAVFALADSHIMIVIIPGLVSEHIKKYAVYRIMGQDFFQDLKGTILLIPSIDTGSRRVMKADQFP